MQVNPADDCCRTDPLRCLFVVAEQWETSLADVASGRRIAAYPLPRGRVLFGDAELLIVAASAFQRIEQPRMLKRSPEHCPLDLNLAGVAT